MRQETFSFGDSLCLHHLINSPLCGFGSVDPCQYIETDEMQITKTESSNSPLSPIQLPLNLYLCTNKDSFQVKIPKLPSFEIQEYIEEDSFMFPRTKYFCLSTTTNFGQNIKCQKILTLESGQIQTFEITVLFFSI